MYNYLTCRLWIFPISSLSAAQKVLREISGYNVEVITCSISTSLYLGCSNHPFSFLTDTNQVPHFSQVEDIDPLVHRAIAAASAVADLQGKVHVHV